MKILVLSDSHSALTPMRRFLAAVRPDAVIHLGDHYDDAQALAEENPQIPFHQVAGNCDRYRSPFTAREMLCYKLGGVMLFMAHGHNHHVKLGIGALLKDARSYGAAAALYGHTHQAYCQQEPDGLWVLNPGACGYAGGTAGLLETDGEKITACRIIGQAELEEIK